MPDQPPNPELLRSLGRLVRGLSALFWGLPLSMVAAVGTGVAGWFNEYRVFGFIPAVVTTGLLAFGVWQLEDFQKQERPWRHALDRTLVFALVNLGLSPFLYWWNRFPTEPLFVGAVSVLGVSAVMFLFNLNLALDRLGAMLPDETLRSETRQFTPLNRALLVGLILWTAIHVALTEMPDESLLVGQILTIMTWLTPWVFFTLTLLPLAMTMALVWKTKEVILDSVFGGK